MKFYRRLHPIKAISFDLDDTLYSNQPVMQETEQGMVKFFARLLSGHGDREFNFAYWLEYRQKAIAMQPELKHDVTALRLTSYYLGCCALGMIKAEAKVKAQQAMDHFIELRSDFEVPEASHQLLKYLGSKVPLVAISNGNVDTDKIAISQHFSHIYHAGKGVLKKPSEDMFVRACQALNIQPRELLHVGDCGHADVLGGSWAGCQTAWFPHYGIGKRLSILPHIELSDVGELRALV